MLDKLKTYWWKLFLISIFCQTVAAVENCDYAKDLLFYAYNLHDNTPSQQKLLFFKSLQACPNQPKVHNSLAAIFKSQGKYEQAIAHYKKSIQLDADLYQTWVKLGNIYYKQERYPLSLEAYSRICHVNLTSKAKIIELLVNKRLDNTEQGEIIEQDSLTVLYDKQRREAINTRLQNCGITQKLKAKHAFLNIYFNTRGTSLTDEIIQQLDEIAATLKNIQLSEIIVHGHTDSRGFAGLTVAESNQRNLQLSLQRATAIVEALAQRGLAIEHLQAYGHGSEHPIVQGNSPEALAKNRRIEIEVTPPIEIAN